MFSRISSSFVAIVAFSIFAAAMPGGAPPTKTATPTKPAPTKTVTVTQPANPTATIPASQCSTGPVQCCNSVQKADSTAASLLLGLLGVVLGNTNVLVGLTCSPLSIIGVGSGGCNAETVCCQNNDFNGLIAIGCTPVNLDF